jgi:hypothetical protein
MPIWLIEHFGAKDLDNTFTFIALMTAPFWIGMIFFPNLKLLRRLARPYVLAPAYCSILFLIIWNAYEASILPDPNVTATYESARDFSKHPITFLLLFCNFQILNLFLGTMMFQKAIKSGFRAPVELLLCCFLGAFALVPFAARLILRKQSLS